MNDQRNCEHFEAMIAAHFDADGIPARENPELSAHIATCASCRESFELSARMEEALLSRWTEVPAVDSFLPGPATARARFAHPRLVAVFRTIMSPTGIAIALVVWSAMLTLRYRHAIAEVFEWTSRDRFSALSQDISTVLMTISGGDPYLLSAIYVALALAVLASTGAITLKYIRHS
jgi:hypothetical protein